MFVLDTDTVTLLSFGHPRVVGRRDKVPASDVSITIITWIEVLEGRFEFLLKAATGEDLLRAQELLDLTARMLADFQSVLPVTSGAASAFDRLRQNRKLTKIGRADLLIASIALAHRTILVTRNLRHFRQVPGLQLENWAD